MRKLFYEQFKHQNKDCSYQDESEVSISQYVRESDNHLRKVSIEWNETVWNDCELRGEQSFLNTQDICMFK